MRRRGAETKEAKLVRALAASDACCCYRRSGASLRFVFKPFPYFITFFILFFLKFPLQSVTGLL